MPGVNWQEITGGIRWTLGALFAKRDGVLVGPWGSLRPDAEHRRARPVYGTEPQGEATHLWRRAAHCLPPQPAGRALGPCPFRRSPFPVQPDRTANSLPNEVEQLRSGRRRRRGLQTGYAARLAGSGRLPGNTLLQHLAKKLPVPDGTGDQLLSEIPCVLWAAPAP